MIAKKTNRNLDFSALETKVKHSSLLVWILVIPIAERLMKPILHFKELMFFLKKWIGQLERLKNSKVKQYYLLTISLSLHFKKSWELLRPVVHKINKSIADFFNRSLIKFCQRLQCGIGAMNIALLSTSIMHMASLVQEHLVTVLSRFTTQILTKSNTLSVMPSFKGILQAVMTLKTLKNHTMTSLAASSALRRTKSKWTTSTWPPPMTSLQDSPECYQKPSQGQFNTKFWPWKNTE